jgi:hypothetical protein
VVRLIRDRGTKKWASSFMMPEHMKMLRTYYKEETRIKKPILDEQKLDEMNEVICSAMEWNEKVKVDIYDEYQEKVVEGYIHYVDPLKGEIRVKDEKDDVHFIPINDILNISM